MVIVGLLILIVELFTDLQHYKYKLLYYYEAIPHFDLKNTLSRNEGVFSGEIIGYVKFDNAQDQPKGTYQYYILKPNYFFGSSYQTFTFEDFIKMSTLPPKSLGVSILTLVNETEKVITLEDKHGNMFFIDKTTKKVSMRDITGDNVTLITENSEYRDFIINLLK